MFDVQNCFESRVKDVDINSIDSFVVWKREENCMREFFYRRLVLYNFHFAWNIFIEYTVYLRGMYKTSIIVKERKKGDGKKHKLYKKREISGDMQMDMYRMNHMENSFPCCICPLPSEGEWNEKERRERERKGERKRRRRKSEDDENWREW